ncbi:hypothetical protein CYMTET_4663 [Cymbomonas tetramitiformis]|uniref:TLC domain-containing protein n=1 Tax=Cymbomonas tetramitiformis TaxID=36881 RepID=A0AAE0H0Q9_9CHLO|nr:hypothetical protein CYMTET_4663 [Cymbomonas tetramitiformis]
MADPRTQGLVDSLPLLVAALGICHIAVSLVCSLAGPFRAAPHKAAHQIISLVDHSICGLYGAYLWIFEAGAIEDKAYEYLEGAAVLLQANFCFQVYDLLASLFIKDFRKPEMIAHHLVTAVLAWWTITGPYLHYYSIFFVGCGEVSSIPLVFVDTFKHFPDVGKRVPTFDVVCKGLFALLFVPIRCIYWPLVSFEFWQLSLHLLNTQTAHNTPIVISFLAANVFLTFLQEYWGYLVYRGVRKMLSGSDKKEK